MKILHLCDHYRPIGGAEKLLFDTLDALESTGNIENLIAMNHYPENRVSGKRKEYIIEHLDSLPVSYNMLSYINNGIRARRKLRSLIAEQEPDVIHIHNIQSPFTVYEAVKTKPTVRSVHDPRLYCFNDWRILRRNSEICPYPLGFHCLKEGCLWPDLLKFTLYGKNAIPKYISYLFHRKADKLIYESEAMRLCLLQNGYNENMLAYLPNFTKMNSLSEVLERKKEFGIENENSILFVGRASFEKGIIHLLKAASLLTIPFKLYLVTGGAMLQEVQSAIKELGLSDSVDLVGVQSYERTKDYYSMADIVVVPSIWIESFCLVGIEAMANATPVVGFRTGGIPDWLVDGETGYLAKCRNTEDLAEKIERLLKNKDAARMMGIKGYHRVRENYCIENYLPRLIDIYQKAIDSRKNGVG